MKKLLILIFGIFLISYSGFSQCPTAPGTGIYVMVNSEYQVGTVASGKTNVGLCYQNTSSTLVTGLQFRIWYDKNAFGGGAPIVTSTNTSFAQVLQYENNLTEGNITITIVYTGSSSTFNMPSGALFNLELQHSANFQTYTNNITNIQVTGISTFNNLSSNINGLDDLLTLHNYGGVMNSVMFNYQGNFVNVTGSPAKNLTLALEKKPKTGSTWTIDEIDTTDLNGEFTFSKSIDTTYYDVRLAVQGDTLSVGNIVTVSDAQRVNQYVLGQLQPSGFDYYSSDVNNSGGITMSDVYGIYGRIAGRFSAWPNNVPDIRFFSASEYASINGSPLNQTQAIPGVTNLIFNILPGQPDSVTFYVLGYGDANGTGYNMARLVPITIINPNNTPNYIMDVTTQYDDPTLDEIEINMPKVVVDEANLVTIPVTLKSNSGPIGSLQMALYYDPSLLEFKEISNSEKSMSWMSFVNPAENTIEWGGFDISGNQHPINDGENIFNLKFLALEPQSDWGASPLWVTRKYSGNSIATDLVIDPTHGEVKIMMVSPGYKNLLADKILIYPNPVEDNVTIAFEVPKKENLSLAIYDINGKLVMNLMEDNMPKGKYQYTYSIGELAAGMYIATLNIKPSLIATAKIIKK
jgi:hypothetical protein